MTNLPTPIPVSSQEQSGSNQLGEILNEVLSLAAVIGRAYQTFCDSLQTAARKADQDHLRGERLAAYRVRHRWKAGDIGPLSSLGIDKIAQQRMAKLKGRGRPVVRPHRPLGSMLHEKLISGLYLFRKDATPNERRHAFRTWPWWKHHVEALYRGELELARAKRVKGAHDNAERAVADALRMSQGKIHAICGEIRALRQEDAEAANFSTMLLTDYESWMEKGERPRQLENRHS